MDVDLDAVVDVDVVGKGDVIGVGDVVGVGVGDGVGDVIGAGDADVVGDDVKVTRSSMPAAGCADPLGLRERGPGPRAC